MTWSSDGIELYEESTLHEVVVLETKDSEYVSNDLLSLESLGVHFALKSQVILNGMLTELHCLI